MGSMAVFPLAGASASFKGGLQAMANRAARTAEGAAPRLARVLDRGRDPGDTPHPCGKQGKGQMDSMIHPALAKAPFVSTALAMRGIGAGHGR